MRQNVLRHAHDFNKNLTVNFIKNTSETTPKTLPNDLQNDHFWHPEPPWGPSGNQSSIFAQSFVISGYPQGDPLGALGHQKEHRILENTQKVTAENYTRKQSLNNQYSGHP